MYVSPARLVVLDEATAGLDPVAEARAENAFAARGGVLVVLAHRLSSALRARRVLLLDGTGPALGTHETLLATSPRYADLMRAWHPTDGTGAGAVKGSFPASDAAKEALPARDAVKGAFAAPDAVKGSFTAPPGGG